MSGSSKETAGPLVAVARATRTRGLKGEIVADLLTDFPERFEGLTTLVIVAPDSKRGIVELEDHWFQKGRIVLKLKGYDNTEASRTLVGYEFAVPESERVDLEEGEFYDWELQSCRVETVAGKHIGNVTGVLRTGGVAMLVVEDNERKERLVPLAESIVLQVNIPERRILIDPPEGLLDL